MVDGGAVVLEVVVGGGGHGARLERHLLGVVLRWALHVVEGAARGAGWGGGGEARHLRVGFRMHCEKTVTLRSFRRGRRNEESKVTDCSLLRPFI